MVCQDHACQIYYSPTLLFSLNNYSTALPLYLQIFQHSIEQYHHFCVEQAASQVLLLSNVVHNHKIQSGFHHLGQQNRSYCNQGLGSQVGTYFLDIPISVNNYDNYCIYAKYSEYDGTGTATRP